MDLQNQTENKKIVPLEGDTKEFKDGTYQWIKKDNGTFGWKKIKSNQSQNSNNNNNGIEKQFEKGNIPLPRLATIFSYIMRYSSASYPLKEGLVKNEERKKELILEKEYVTEKLQLLIKEFGRESITRMLHKVYGEGWSLPNIEIIT